MARNQVSPTSITTAVADRFLKSAKERDTLTCKNIKGFMLIKLGQGGAWRWRYTDEAGKRRVATIGSYAEFMPFQAADRVIEWRISGADPLRNKDLNRRSLQAENRAAEHRTLRNYLKDYYLPHMERSWKPENVKINYGRIAGQFAVLLDRDMQTIDKADIDSWQRGAESKGLTYATIRRCYGALKTLLRRAVKDEILHADPLDKHKLLEPSRKDQARIQADPGKADRRMLTHNEIQGVLNGLEAFGELLRDQRRNSRSHGKPELSDLDKVPLECVNWFIPFTHLALHTGLRPGDLYSLRWEELNIRFGRLTKVCEKTSHAIRRDKKPAVVDMSLNATIKSVMSKWHAHQGKPDSGLVFPSPRTGKQLNLTAHKGPWKQVKELGELQSGLNFYALRHHFISAMLAAGVDVFTVAKLAGHKDVKMIMDHYGHLCPDQATKALDIVARTVVPKARPDEAATSTDR